MLFDQQARECVLLHFAALAPSCLSKEEADMCLAVISGRSGDHRSTVRLCAQKLKDTVATARYDGLVESLGLRALHLHFAAVMAQWQSKTRARGRIRSGCKLRRPTLRRLRFLEGPLPDDACSALLSALSEDESDCSQPGNAEERRAP